MKKEPQINLFSVPITLFHEHLSDGVDQLKQALETPESERQDDFRTEWRRATSSIIRGFSALDGLSNHLGFELFFNSKSEHFIDKDNRSYALMQMLKSWKRLSVLNKIELILAETNSESLRPKYIQNLNELNTLRNWLVHGVPYTITYLEETTWEGSQLNSTLHDFEDNFDKSKFPNTHFNSPASLSREDARTALLIVIEIMTFILSEIRWFHTIIVTHHQGKKEHWLGYDSTVEALIESFGLS